MSGPAPPSAASINANAQTADTNSQAFNTATANQQQGFNTATAGQQQGFNIGSQAGSQYSQANPYANLNYVQTGVGPNGVPIYGIEDQYSPVEQGLFGATTGTQQTAGTQAGQLLQAANYGAETPQQEIGAMTSGITGQNLGAEVSSLEPYFNIQTEQENAQLANQGINPTENPTAYNNAMLPFLTGQNTAVTNFLASQEPTVQQQSMNEYTLPATLATSELGPFGAPASLNANYSNATPSLGTTTVTPTTVQPVNTSANLQAEGTIAENQYQAQQAQYNALMQGLFGLGSSALGGLALGGALSGTGGLFSSPSYGGGNVFTDAYGGSASNPLPGLTAADYG